MLFDSVKYEFWLGVERVLHLIITSLHLLIVFHNLLEGILTMRFTTKPNERVLESGILKHRIRL
jgi:hypothetical protein